MTHALLFPFIPHHPQSAHVPPLRASPAPARLPHQTHNRLCLGPSLLRRDVGEVGRSEAFAAVGERDPETVRTHGPVKRVRRRGKVGQEGDGNGQGGKFGQGDGGEAGIVEGPTA